MCKKRKMIKNNEKTKNSHKKRSYNVIHEKTNPYKNGFKFKTRRISKDQIGMTQDKKP